jgi:prolyl oligopeptidase
MKRLLPPLAATVLGLAAFFSPPAMTAETSAADPYLWLEDVQGERALAWVRERNAQSRQVLEAFPRFASMRDDFRAILDSREKIPYFSRRGDWLYNFWQDASHQRGLWRRTTLAEYRKPEPAWELLLDLDALAKAEGENWVWHGAQCLAPAYERCLMKLSRGGADAGVVREFDIREKRFINNGFTLPEAKSDVGWASPDAIYVGTDFGPGSLTDSGYPRVIKRWQRGQALSAATTVFEGQKQDVAVSVSVDRTPGFERTVFQRATDFYNSEQFLLAGDKLQKIAVPSDASVSFWGEHALVRLRSAWQQGAHAWPSGSLLIGNAKALLVATQADQMPPFQALFTPSSTRSMSGFSTTKTQVLVNGLDNVAGRLEAWRHDGQRWVSRSIPAPYPGTLQASALYDSELPAATWDESYTLTYTDFVTPDSLMLGSAQTDKLETLKARPAYFDAQGIRVEQRFATSQDGTKVPYFVVWPKGAQANGKNPTLLYGYGGFEVSLEPWYSAGFGKAWYTQGGVLVVANIRGGGEYGPAWHQAAVQANKQKSYDDFAAVAQDLITHKITSPAHLGIEGGSNGGLLVGAVMVQRPELFGAVVCQVPLLDMQRYHKLLAGASWMAEYGDPEQPEQWAWISKFSPYQNVKAGVKMPKVLFTTSTRDDRVHPGHARKMAARMIEQGHAPLYYENVEGGHAGAADSRQKADMMALEFSFLWRTLAPEAKP